jgi:hypothetical protein
MKKVLLQVLPTKNLDTNLDFDYYRSASAIDHSALAPYVTTNWCEGS